MLRDLISNLKIIDFLPPITRVPGVVYTSKFDTRTSQVTVGGSREALTNLLLAISVSEWGVGGTIDVVIQHCATENGTYATHSTIAQMLQSESEDLYLAELKDYNRWVRLAITFAGAIVDVAIVGIGNCSRRAKVVQVGTEKAVTEA